MSETIYAGRMPILALRGLTVFPEQTVHFDVGRLKSVMALDAAMKDNRTLLLVPQKDIQVDDPGLKEKQNQHGNRKEICTQIFPHHSMYKRNAPRHHERNQCRVRQQSKQGVPKIGKARIYRLKHARQTKEKRAYGI